MSVHQKELKIGIGLIVGFFIVLFLMFMPIMGEGQNTLNYMDNLYNSISKGSAYYIPKLQEETQKGYQGKNISVELHLDDEKLASLSQQLFEKAGVSSMINGTNLMVSGDMGKIMTACLADSDNMFHNRGEEVKNRYGQEERLAMFAWWKAMQKLEYALTKQSKFSDAKFVSSVNSRAVECAYNYYKIVPQKIMDKAFVVFFSLVFYVIYTLWFGYSILYLFEGWGLQIGGH